MTSTRSEARADWEQRIGKRSGTGAVEVSRLAAPTGLTAVPGRGQVTLDWDEVAGAIGYQLYVDDGDGEFRKLDHGGGDVLSVPHPPYADTTGTPGVARAYRVSTLSDVDIEGDPSEAVAAAPEADGDATVRVSVDAASDAGVLHRPWRPMIGSEHLSHALSTDTTGGRVVGEELSAALAAAHLELGVATVRAHGILCDDLGVYREIDGAAVHDFTGVDAVYDHIRSIGLRPVVELSFMPRDLASDPTKTVFDYGAIVSPPKDWDRWYGLIRDLVQHLVDRYGIDEVREHWSFEVWNEANLEVFWSGTPEEFWRLYDLSAAAVVDVDASLTVGGPSTAAAGWVEDLLAHADESGARVDFVSTHTYGSAPLDFRPALARHDRAGIPIWWTEWGVTPTHFNEVSDAVFAGVFLARGMASAMDRIDALSYWVVSDHFEELGRPPSLLHGGFGLRTVGELRKPRWWTLALLNRLGSTRLRVESDGDGAGSLVESIGARTDSLGRVGIAIWNLTLDQSKAGGSSSLHRWVEVSISGLAPNSAYTLSHHRVDADHSNVAKAWGALRRPDQDWPDDDQWEALRQADELEAIESPHTVEADESGTVGLAFELPMPAMSLLELDPA